MTNFRTLFLFFILLFSVSIINATELPESAYIQQLTIDPVNPEIVYAATTSSGLYRLTDGTYWKNITPAETDSAYYVARLLPGNPSILFASGEKTGLWYSSDQGDTWTCAGLKGISVVEMAIDPSTPYRAFALTRDAIQHTQDGGYNVSDRYSGVYRTEDYRTAEWQHVLNYAKLTKETGLHYEGGDTWIYTRFQKIVINPHNPQEIWLGARWEGGYHRSTDGGDTWQNHWISGIFRRVDPIVFHPTDPNIVFVGTHHQGWFKTYNNGQSWVSLSRGLESEPRNPHYGAFLISGVIMNPQNPNEFYTGSDYSNWKTTNGGVSWQELGQSLTCEFARTMAINPVDDNIIYAGTNVGVFRSIDRGQTWVPLNSGFPKLPIKQQLTAKIDGSTYEFALTQKGPKIFRRPKEGNSEWRSINWLLRTKADSMSFNTKNETITLHTEDGPIVSYNGGIRWDIPEIEY
ncbi:hypothetical protein KAH55_00735, partial [bacterium]|nr:hypothetical protein [bacterium]